MGPQGLDFLHLLLLVELCMDLVQQGKVQTLHQVRVLQVASTICPGPRGSGWSGGMAMRHGEDSFYWFCPGLEDYTQVIHKSFETTDLPIAHV